jgi:hypothetical protein
MKTFFTSVALLLIGSVIGSFFGYRFHERYVADGGEGANMKTLLIIVGTAAITLFTFRAVESLGGLMLAQPQYNRKQAGMYLIAVLAPPIYFLRKKKWVSFITAFLLLGFAVLFGIAGFCLIGIILWVLCSIDALWDLRKEVPGTGRPEVQPVIVVTKH